MPELDEPLLCCNFKNHYIELTDKGKVVVSTNIQKQDFFIL